MWTSNSVEFAVVRISTCFSCIYLDIVEEKTSILVSALARKLIEH